MYKDASAKFTGIAQTNKLRDMSRLIWITSFWLPGEDSIDKCRDRTFFCHFLEQVLLCTNQGRF